MCTQTIARFSFQGLASTQSPFKFRCSGEKQILINKTGKKDKKIKKTPKKGNMYILFFGCLFLFLPRFLERDRQTERQRNREQRETHTHKHSHTHTEKDTYEKPGGKCFYRREMFLSI